MNVTTTPLGRPSETIRKWIQDTGEYFRLPKLDEATDTSIVPYSGDYDKEG